jgi:hypothetical protein
MVLSEVHKGHQALPLLRAMDAVPENKRQHLVNRIAATEKTESV